jgi:ADP-heptose:LPS heptosyltransferase
MNIPVQKIFFAGTSRVTDVFPVFGGHLLNSTIRATYGSRAMSALVERGNRKCLKRVTAFRRFLVIPDTHIGDSVTTQSAPMVLRALFPEAEIDYVVNKTAAPLIEGNPDVTRIFPVFSGGLLPSPDNMATLRGIIQKGRYDLCLNFCPFMEGKDLAEPGQPLVGFLSRGPTIVRNETDSTQINHFIYQAYHFVRELFPREVPPVHGESFRGVRTNHSDEAIEQARRFVTEAGVVPRSRVIMFNPDSAVRFNLMPFESQAALLVLLAKNTASDTTILLGAGHTEAGIGERLADSTDAVLRSKVRIIPQRMSLEVYSALTDFADVFISGDTGPLHLAAARRFSRSGRHQFRNRTAVLSFFGATTPRLSGYDSIQPGYLPANQDAPSWCYVAGSPCRNITCLNKMFKTCKTVRCFEHVDVAGLAALVCSHLDSLSVQIRSR